MKQSELYINKAAQKIIPMKDALQWFDLQSESERMLVLKALAHMCLQSSPLIKDIADAISQSGLSPASMACEILKRTRPIADAI